MSERLNVMVTGGSGFVAHEVVKSLQDRNELNLSTPTHKEVDILEPNSIRKWIEENDIKTIWHFAAHTNVDAAQKDPGTTYRINFHATKDMFQLTKKYGVHFVFLSTDFVFPGTEDCPGPYHPYSKRANSNQIGVYANSKLLAEKVINSSIVRISYPFGNLNSPKDYLGKILKFVKTGNKLATDQLITPTYIPDLADALFDISTKQLDGIYHVATFPVTTPYEIAKMLVKKTASDYKILSGSIHDFLNNGVAPRPIFGGLVSSGELEITPLREAIDRVLFSTD
jgi:dTDP-4-dehydrorhamnose reductase